MAATLRRISRNLVPLGQPLRPFRSTRHAAAAPYGTDELATLVETATTLADATWRARASLLLALTAGAGLRDADLRLLGPDAIVCGPGPVRVVVPDTEGRGRTVPLHRDFAALAVQALRTDGEPADPAVLFPARDVSNRLWTQLTLPAGVSPTARRLRATWSALVLASGCGLPAYLRAAHIVSVDSWFAAVEHLVVLDEDEYLSQARGDSHLEPGHLPPGEEGRGHRPGHGLALDGNPWPSPTVPLRAAPATPGQPSSKGGRR